MSAGETVSTGDGEFLIGPDAIYTFVHYYQHPDTRQMVVLIGMDHFADAAYFEEVKELLRTCDLVLLEDVSAERFTPEAKDQILAWAKGQISSDSLDEALMGTVGGAYAAMAIMLNLPYEGDFFVSEDGQPHWVNVDLFTNDKEAEDEFYKTLGERLSEMPLEHKEKLVTQARQAIGDVENDDSPMAVFRDFLISVEFDEVVDQIMNDVMIAPRNAHCLQEFDRLVAERSPEFIGIKFGTHHISSLRAALEERGYIHQGSRDLRALALT